MAWVRLCGGQAHGLVMEIRRVLPPDLRVPIADVLEVWTPDVELPAQTTVREEIYYLTGVVSRNGEFIYVSGDFGEQLGRMVVSVGTAVRQIVDAMRRTAAAMQEARLERDSYASSITDAARMSGVREYPLDAIRQDTEKLIDRIDNMTDEVKHDQGTGPQE